LKIQFAFIGLVSIFLCCKTSKSVVSDSNTIPAEIDYTQGAELISKSDCLTCHKSTEKYIGPSWNDIAIMYSNPSDSIINKLSNKIKIGGFGPWGVTPMAPHLSKTKEELDAIVKYILLTKHK